MMQKDRIKVGAGVILISVDALARDWCLTEEDVQKFLAFFGLPCLKFPGGEKRYVSLYPLEEALFEATLPKTFQGDRALVKSHHELAGVLYGTLTKQAIKDRVLSLARVLSQKRLAQTTRRKKKRKHS